MKKILFLAMLSTAIAFTSCIPGGGEDSEDVNVTGITLKKTTLALEVGGGEILEYTITPDDADDQTVTWSSSDDAVASVDLQGLVTGVKIGTATITVTTVDGGKTATCEVTVTDELIAVEGVTLNKTTLSLNKDDKETLVATVSPDNATDKNVSWTSSDETVATVSTGGEVTALKAGTATITVTSVADNTKKATCMVTVTEAKPEQISEYTTAIEAGQGIEPTTGDGTEANPYLIASAENLKWMKHHIATSSEPLNDKYYKLTTSINVTADTWLPIENFKGHFDGDNHKITGKLTAASDLKLRFGFFGYTSGSASIKNLKNEAEIYAPNCNWVGSILGNARDFQQDDKAFSITNCTNSAKITGKQTVGGIVGYISMDGFKIETAELTIMENCINTGEINAEAKSGGIAAIVFLVPNKDAQDNDVKITIKNCHNEGNVSTIGQFTGGISGETAFYKGTIIYKGCTNTGLVKSGETQADKQQGDKENNFLGLITGGNEYTGIITIE